MINTTTIKTKLEDAERKLLNFSNMVERTFKKISDNYPVVNAAGRSIATFLEPALKMQHALNEISVQGVEGTALKSLANNAIAYSIKYGTSAEEFIASTNSIRNEIHGLTNHELPHFSTAINTLAFATKSSAADTAVYMGDMYNQFKATADAMGRVKWAEKLAGQSAYMYSAFALDPSKIRDLMIGTNGAGSEAGIGMNEQLAVLGELSQTLGENASGTYEKFLNNAAAAGRSLGISFTDANGQLLAMPEILGKLQEKYGKTIDSNLNAQHELKKAFGDGVDVITILYNSTEKLNGHINALGSNAGMGHAAKMAEKMTNPIDRFNATLQAARIIVGNALLPVLTPLIEILINAGNQFNRWMLLFPNIAKLIGYITLGIISFTAIVSLLNIGIATSLLLLRAWNAAVSIAKTIWTAFSGVIWLWHSRALIVSRTMTILRSTIAALSIVSSIAGTAFSFMSWPILLIVAAIALLVVGVIALIKYWDDIKAAISNTAAFEFLVQYISYVGGIFNWIWDLIKIGWKAVCEFFENFSFIDTFNNAIDSISSLFLGLWESIKNQFTGVYNSIVSKLNKIPGINIKLKTISEPVTAPSISNQSLLTGGQVKDNNLNGGIKQSLSNNSSIDNSRNIQTLNIYPPSQQAMVDMMEWSQINAG